MAGRLKIWNASTGTWDYTSGSGSVATDPLWVAGGDIVVATGAGTAARLAKGNAGAVLAMGNGSVIWNAGTSFPANKLTGDRYFRTDLGIECYWDGTRWLGPERVGDRAAWGPNTADGNAGYSFVHQGDVKLVGLEGKVLVIGTNNASNYWTYRMHDTDGGVLNATHGSGNTSAMTPSTWTAGGYSNSDVIVSTLLGVLVSFVKTGAPGSFYGDMVAVYRRIYT